MSCKGQFQKDMYDSNLKIIDLQKVIGVSRHFMYHVTTYYLQVSVSLHLDRSPTRKTNSKFRARTSKWSVLVDDLQLLHFLPMATSCATNHT